MRSYGWLFDVYPARTTMVVWLYADDGTLLRLEDPFRAWLYVRGAPGDLRVLTRRLSRAGLGLTWRRATRREFWAGRQVPVLALGLADYAQLPRLRRRLPEFEPRLSFANCDIPLPQYYLSCRRLFPFARCEVEHSGEIITRIRAVDANAARHYALPSLRTLELTLTLDPLIPLLRGNTLVITLDGQAYELTTKDPVEMLETLNGFLTRYDPDLLFTDHGDTAILPQLLVLARRHGVSLALDRDPLPITRRIITEGRSFVTYGRMLYHPPGYPLYGRWHIDRAHSFVYRETGFEGLVELARLAHLPVQRVARASIGTILTAMPLDLAVRRRILIPWRKGEPERWKTAALLLKVDKGGLVFQPPVGVFAGVAELDYASMYPTIMVTHNVSAETLFCRCCQNAVVTEAGYAICTRRRGLIPQLLAPLLARRAYYKAQLRQPTLDPALAQRYEACQSALKWIGVTCFGYLGYHNARFGRIESHEAVTAFGREKLLQAKEIAEAHGYQLLHALTDAVWVQHPGATAEDLAALCAEITRVTGVAMQLEGRYRWVAFLPSKVRTAVAVATRYFGVFTDGTWKARGLAYRRHDVPVCVQRTPLAMLGVLAEAEDLAGVPDQLPRAVEVLRESWDALASGRIPLVHLLVTKTVGREPGEYRVDTATALALRQLADVGLHLHPGERVRYLIRHAKAANKEERVRAYPRLGADDGFDLRAYQALLLDAALELLTPFGYDAARLRGTLR
jgi:DNA polymerase II